MRAAKDRDARRRLDDMCRSLVLVLGLLVVLTGCGTGGDHHDPEPVPSATPLPRPGTIDAGFGIGGFAVTGFPGDAADDVAYAVAVQPDGKIVAAGSTASSGDAPQFAVARYLPHGTLDPTFGDDGRVLPIVGVPGIATDVAVAPDGTIVVVGDGGPGFVVVRLGPDGRQDESFGEGGAASSPGFITEADLAIQPDGKILVAGTVFGQSTTMLGVVRYQADGTLDATFGDHGVAASGIGPSNDARALLLQPDGTILVGGSGQPDDAAMRFLVVRHLPDGSLDAGFGDGGIVQTDVTPGRLSRITALALREDGAVLALGSAGLPVFGGPFVPGGPRPPDPDGGPLVLVRYRADGSLDATFGDGGIVPTAISIDPATPILVQPDGRILVGDGLRFEGAASVRRLLPDGALDASFGDGGTFAMHVRPDDNSALFALAFQDDGRLVAAGFSRPSFTQGDFAVTRVFAQ
jgi:uncharacterized delta-60 repeat protein